MLKKGIMVETLASIKVDLGFYKDNSKINSGNSQNILLVRNKIYHTK